MDGIDITKLTIKSPFDLVGDVKEEIATVVETAEETVEVASNTTTIDDIDILKLSISIPFELIPNQDTAVTAQ